MKKRQFIAGAGAVTVLLPTLSRQSFADTYPTHSIRMLVGFSPGGTTSIVGRIVAKGLTERLGQSVVLENHPGADGMIASEMVAKAAPDGYTLVFCSSTQGANPVLYPDIQFDTVKDFASIGLAAATSYVLVVNAATVPVHTVPELITYLKANPGKVVYGNPGGGTEDALAGMLLKGTTGVKMTEVNYKGSGNVTTDLLSGRTSLAFGSLAVYAPFVQSGTLRALAVTGPTRSKIFPNVPTMVESGFPNFKIRGWFGLFGPAGMPADAITKINRAIGEVVAEPEVIKLFDQQGLEPLAGPPSALTAVLKHEISAWKTYGT